MTKDLEAIRKIGEIHDALVADGVKIPDAYKRRDPREPGRVEKELAEAKLEKLIKRLFAGQKKRIRTWLETQLPSLKQAELLLPEPPEDLFDDPAIQALIVALFVLALNGGIDIVNADSDDILNVLAAQTVALDFVTFSHAEWLAGLNDTTREALQSALDLFRTTPGMTIQDVMDLLPFEPHRLQRIAITEITRMYGKGAQIAGEQLAKDFPGVRVIKTWHTNADDIVCPICRPLNGVSVKIKSTFTGGLGKQHLHPPAHVNCRCWMSVKPDINKTVRLQKK